MDINRIFKSGKKDVVITLRIDEENKKFIDKHNISPSALFRECLEDLKESIMFNKKIKLRKAWSESNKKGNEKFSVCKKCGKVYFAKTKDLENNIRLCGVCKS